MAERDDLVSIVRKAGNKVRYCKNLVVGEFFSEIGYLKGAISEVEKALALNPNDEELLSWATAIYRAANDYKNLITVLERRIEASPEPRYLRIELIEAYLDADELEKAILEYKKIENTDEWVYTYDRDLGTLLFFQERFSEARPVLKRAAKYFPEDHDVMEFLGLTYSRLGLHEKAIDYLEKALEIREKNKDVDNDAIIYDVEAMGTFLEEYRRILESDDKSLLEEMLSPIFSQFRDNIGPHVKPDLINERKDRFGNWKRVKDRGYVKEKLFFLVLLTPAILLTTYMFLFGEVTRNKDYKDNFRDSGAISLEEDRNKTNDKKPDSFNGIYGNNPLSGLPIVF